MWGLEFSRKNYLSVEKSRSNVILLFYKITEIYLIFLCIFKFQSSGYNDNMHQSSYHHQQHHHHPYSRNERDYGAPSNMYQQQHMSNRRSPRPQHREKVRVNNSDFTLISHNNWLLRGSFFFKVPCLILLYSTPSLLISNSREGFIKLAKVFFQVS